MRDVLRTFQGLTPKRLALAAAALLCFAGTVLAGPREDAAAAMARCDLIKENAAWLDCHERATAQMRAALSATPRALPPAPVRPADAAAAAQRFGAENLPTPRAAARAPKRLVARVREVSFSKNGYFTIGLDNGQWWRQLDGDTSYARFREPADRNIVTIEHGLFGSYNLHIRGLSQGYKVNRVR
jgi:hypothetical protein